MVLLKVDGTWTPATLTSYGSEAELQELLAADTSLIPGCAGNAAAQEMSIPGSGYADLVLVDELGAITVVECKLQANPQIRREVVGQVLEYASLLWRLSYGEFEQAFRARAHKSLVEAVRAAGTGDLDEEEFRERVSESLAAGRFRLVVAVDQITPRLRASIEYLNAQTSADVAVMALELGYLKQGDVEVLVPATYGAEVTVVKQPSGAIRRWSESDVVDAVEQIERRECRDVVQALLEHARARGAVVKGGTGASPSAGYYYLLGEQRRSVWSLYVKPDGPVIAVNLGSIRGAGEHRAVAALEALRRSPLLASRLPEDDATAIARYPEIAVIDLLADGGAAPLPAAVEAAVNAADPEPPA